MFDVNELKEKGAKRATQDYIASEDSSIPVPESVEMRNIENGTIIRSDHWREFDDFYGIFESVIIGDEMRAPGVNNSAIMKTPEQAINLMHFKETGINEIDERREYYNNLFEEYCKAKGLSPEHTLSELKIFPQKKIDSRLTGTIFYHPNVPEKYMLYSNSKHSENLAFIIDQKNNDIVGEHLGGRLPLDDLLKNASINIDDIDEVIQLYDRTHSLPKFQDDFVYMMEFTIDPTYVLQMRRFRKFEDGSNLECSWKEDKDIINMINKANPDVHYRTTAPEIYEALGGKVDALVAGVGTGGTITGIGRFLKEKLGEKVKIIAVEPEESAVLSGKPPGSHGIQGIGAGFIPEITDTSLFDEILTVSLVDAISTSRALASKEGIFAGISAGANVASALKVAKRYGAGANIVTILCDTGERYLSHDLWKI